ncbi:retrovirus-related pol polyprotein from transposon TNT 1-94 [Tanacetum coccineum]
MSSSLAENVIVAEDDNRPPMLDKTQYNSWASFTVPGTATTPATVRDRTYDEHTNAEKIREGCDIKATNIVLQGLPQDIYNLVNHHTEAKDIWDRVKLLIEGSEISLQERESKLYDEFDMFTLVPGETIHTYYLRFAQLINDMHSIGMTMMPIQINTKFINHLQPEWRKFVTDVKLSKDLHNTNFDHLYGYLRQHEAHAEEVRLTRQRYSDPIALVVNTSNSSPSNHATILDGKVKVQTVHGRQQQGYASTGVRNNATGSSFNKNGGTNTAGQAKVVHCYNCQEEGHMARQCIKPKRLRNSAWFREKAMLAETLESGVALDKEQMTFLADNGDVVTTGQASQDLVTTTAFQTDDLDAFDYDCDEAPSASVVLMAKLSMYDSDVLSETKEDNYLDQIIELEKKNKTLDNVVYKMGQSTQTMHMLTKPQDFYDEAHKTARGYQNPLYLSQAQWKVPSLYCGNTIIKPHDVLFVLDTEETLELAEENVMSVVMHAIVKNANCLEHDNLESEPLKKENDRLFELLISQDLVHTAVNSSAEIIDYQNMEKSYLDEYAECVQLKAKLSKQNNMINKDVYNELSK